MTQQHYDRLEFEVPETPVKLAFDACVACACVVIDKDRHDKWHDKVAAASLGLGGLVGL